MREQTELKQKIETVRREYRKAERRALLGWAVVATLGSLIVLGILDKIFTFPTWERQVLLGGTGVVLIASFIVLYAKRIRKAIPDEKIALYIEERLSGFDEALVTAAAIKPETLPPEERPLAEALLRKVTQKIKKKNLNSAVDFRKARTAMAATIFAVLAALLTAIFLPTQIARVTVPISRTTPPPSALEIDITPKSIEVERGGKAEIVAKTNGLTSLEATLVYTPIDNAERKIPMQWNAAVNRYETELSDITSDGVYKVMLKEKVSPEYPVKTFIAPAVESAEHTYTFPDYLRMPPKREKGTEIKAVQGTKATVTFQLNKPVEKCEITDESNKKLPVKLNDREAQFELEIKKDETYTVHLTDSDGRTNGDGKTFSVSALADNPPEVTIVEPSGDVELDSGMEQALRVESNDDFGVTKLTLVYNINGEEEHRIDLSDSQTDIPPRTRIGNFTVSEESVNLKLGDVMTYYAEAEDTNILTGPGKTQTKKFFIFGMLPYTDAPPGSGPKTPPPSLTAIQRQIIVATTSLAETPKAEKTIQYNDDCTKVGTSEGELLGIVKKLHEKVSAKGDKEKEALCEEVEPLLASARDDLQTRAPEDALDAEQKSLPLLYRLDSKIRKPESASNSSGSSDQLFHDILTKQVTESSLPDEMKEGQPCSNCKACTSEEYAPELVNAVRRMEELARRQAQLNQSQEKTNADAEKDRQKNLAKEQEELADAAEELAKELEKTAGQNRDTSSMASAASQLKKAAQQMKAGAANMANAKAGSAKANARAAEQSLMEALNRLSSTSEKSMSEQLKDASREARSLAEQQRQLNKQSATAANGNQGTGNGQNNATDRAENNASNQNQAEKQDALAKDIQEWRKNLERLHEVSEELSESGALSKDTPEQIEKALGRFRGNPLEKDEALLQAADILDAAANLEMSPEERMDLAARDAAELVAGIEKMTSGSLAEGSGTEIKSGGGIGGPGKWNNLDWACLHDAGIRNAALVLEEKLALANKMQEAERIDFLKAEVLPLAKKLEEQLAAKASGTPEHLLLTKGFDDNYPPEYRSVVEDYFKKLARHPELASEKDSEATTTP